MTKRREEDIFQFELPIVEFEVESEPPKSKRHGRWGPYPSPGEVRGNRVRWKNLRAMAELANQVVRNELDWRDSEAVKEAIQEMREQDQLPEF